MVNKINNWACPLFLIWHAACIEYWHVATCIAHLGKLKPLKSIAKHLHKFLSIHILLHIYQLWTLLLVYYLRVKLIATVLSKIGCVVGMALWYCFSTVPINMFIYSINQPVCFFACVLCLHLFFVRLVDSQNKKL